MRNNRFTNRAAAGKALASLLKRYTNRTDVVVLKDERTGHIVFDVQLLVQRLSDAARWVRAHPKLAKLPIAYFGASTGAAAALIAASNDPEIRAIVSRGGRPVLAISALARVRAPTLFIVGGHDTQVLEHNRQAMGAMRGEVELMRARASFGHEVPREHTRAAR